MVDLGDTILSEALPIGEALCDLFNFYPQRPISSYTASLNQCLPFPKQRTGFVIGAECVNTRNERPRFSRWAKLHIDLVCDPFFGGCRKVRDKFLANTHIIFVGCQFSLKTAAAHGIFGRVVDENKIEIRIVIKLPASHFSHSHHSESAVWNSPKLLFEFLQREFQRALQRSLGKIRKLSKHRH